MRLKSYMGFFTRNKPITKKRAESRNSKLLVEMLERRDLMAAPAIVFTNVLPLDGSTTATATPAIRVVYSEAMTATATSASNYVLLGSSGNSISIDSVAFESPANSSVLITYNGGAPTNPNAQLVVDTYTLFIKGDRIFDVDESLPLAQPAQLIVANSNLNNIGVVSIVGDGTLGAISNYNMAPVGPQAPLPREVAFGDLDSDGIKDLVVINGGTNQALVYLGQPATEGGGFDTDPAFTLTLPTTPVNSVRKMAIADVNKDGKLDLAITNSFSSATVIDNVSVFVNTTVAPGSLAFAAGTTTNVDPLLPVAPAPTSEVPVGIAAGDFDGDGNVDLAVMLNTAFNDLNADTVLDYRVAIMAGDGLGGFTVPAGTSRIRIGDTAAFAVGSNFSLAAGNVSGDGKSDLIIGVDAVANSGVYVFTNVSVVPGTFAFTPLAPVVTANVRAVATGNINGDGSLDIVASLTNNTVEVLRNLGAGAFANTSVAVTAGAGGNLAVGDLNNDNRDEIIVSDGVAGNEITVLVNASAGPSVAFTPRIYNVGSNPLGIAISTVAHPTTLTRNIANITSAGDGVAATAVRLSGVGGAFKVGDVIQISGVAGFPSGTYTIAAIPSATATFTFDLAGAPSNVAINATGGTATVRPSDANQDGFADVVVANNLGNSVTLFSGEGNGDLLTGANFSMSPTVTAGVVVADVNGDGLPDIVSFSNNSANSGTRVSIRQGQTGGNYGAEVLFSVNAAGNTDVSLTSLAVADINGDNRPDIIVTGFGGGGFGGGNYKVAFLRNNIVPGNAITLASFSPLGDMTVNRNPMQVVVGDFNSDGANDLAIAHNGSGGFGFNNRGVDILIGNTTAGVANGTFQNPLNYLNNTRLESLVVGDFNKDGALDIVAGENNAPGNIHALFGDGFGNFFNGGSFATGVPNVGSIRAADMNGDGFLDVIVGSESTSLSNAGIAVLFNQFGTGFASAIQSDVVPGTGINSILATDVNQDGFIDVVAATTLPRVTGTITAVSSSGGLFRVTSNNHGLSTGDQVVITGSNVPSMNGTWTINVPGGPGSGNTFDLVGSTFVAGFTGTATWTLAGTFTLNDNVFVLISKGNGTFHSAIPYEVGANPTQIAAPSYLAATNSALIRVTTFTTGGTVVNPNLVSNGNFEATDLTGEVGNLLGWQSYDLQGPTGGSHGAWRVQSGTTSPLSGATVPVPTGNYRAMLDQNDLIPITGIFNFNANVDYAGSHALYQDITIPANATDVRLSLNLFIDNSAAQFSNTTLTSPQGSLDYRTPQDNQQVRIDIVRTTAAPLSVSTTPASGAIASAVGAVGGPIIITTATNHGQSTGGYVTIAGVLGYAAANGLFRVTVIDATHFSLDGTTIDGASTVNTGTWSVTGDVMLNVFQTTTSDPTLLSTTLSNIDLTAFAGQTIRLRIGSANNQGKLLVGVDNVRINAKFADDVAPTITGVGLSNPSYIDAALIAHTNDPTLIGRVYDNGGIENLSYIEIDPTNSGFTSNSTVKITAWDTVGNFTYTLPVTSAGFVTVALRVVDKAGNVTPTTFTFYMQASSVTEWEPVGPQGIDVTGQFVDYTKISGRVTTILVDSADPTGNTYFIGSVNGGVWKTTNGGATWVALMNTITDSTGSPIPVAISSIAQSTMEPVDPANPALGFRENNNILYAATGVADLLVDSRPGIGILKSTDHGDTWTLIGDSSIVLAGARISKVVVDANNPKVVYVGVASGGAAGPGVYKTTDGGLTWVNILTPGVMTSGGVTLAPGTALASVTDLIIDPANSNRLLIGLGNIGLAPDSATAGLWRSANNGGGWDRIVGGDAAIANNTLPTGINLGRVTVAIGNTRTGNEGIVYVMIANKIGNNTAPSVDFGTFAGLYKTKDNMLNFTRVMLKDDVGFAPLAPFGTDHDFRDINIFGRDSANVGSLVVDPTNPNVVYIGGSNLWSRVGDAPNHSLIRVDTGNMRDTTYIGPGGTIPNDGDDIDKAAAAANKATPGFYYTNGTTTPPSGFDPYVGEGVYWYDLDSAASGDYGFFDYLPEQITSLAIDSQGRLLTGTMGGIWRGVPLGFGYDITSGGTGITTTGFGGGGGGGGGGGFGFTTPGMTFTSLNGNLSISDISSVAIDPYNRGVYFTTQIGTGVAGSTAPLVWVSQGLTGPTTAGGFTLPIPNASSVIAAKPAFGTPAGTPITLYRLWQYADPRALQPEISTDNGATWQSINSTGISSSIPASMFPAFTIDSTPRFLNGQFRNALAFGTQVVYISETDGTVWDQRSPVLSAGSAISAISFAPSTAGVLYAATTDGKIFYTASPGPSAANWPQRNTATLPATSTQGVYVRGITVDPDDSDIAYVMYGDGGAVNEVQTINVPATVTGFQLTFNGSTTATIPFTNTPATDLPVISAALNALASVSGVGGTATVVSQGGGLYSITYSGGSLAATDLPQITAAVVAGTGAVAVGTLTNGVSTGFDHVYVTKDAGVTWEAVGAQAITAGGLPKVPAYSMVIDRTPSLGAPNGKMYLATEVGVFVSLDDGANWSRFGAGMPNVPVVDLKLDTDRVNPDGSITEGLHVLAAATLGRGIYTINTAAFSFIPDQVIDEDTPTPVIPMTINDPTGTTVYNITLTSNNQTLIPNANIVLSGTGINRTVQVTPAANLNDVNAGGPVTITVTLTSGTFTYTQTFTVSVTPVNDLPTITLADGDGTREILVNSTNNLIQFTVNDVETPANAIVVTATSANQSLIPNSGLVVTAGVGGARTLSITPAANQTGSTQITILMNDGTGGIKPYVFDILVTRNVTLTPTPFTDNFNRADNSVFLGTGWKVQSGDFDLINSEAVATSATAFNIVTLNGLSTTNAAIEADVKLTTGAFTYDGFVARYTSTGGLASYYWGVLVNVNGASYAQIHKVVNGVFQPVLWSQVVSYTAGTTARLRFEVVRDSLKLFLNDTLVAYANDTQISAPATFGVFANQGSSFDNFVATELTPTNAAVPSSEPFNVNPPRNQLDLNWRSIIGDHAITGTGAAAAALGVGAVNISTLNTATPQTDGFVEATVTVSSTVYNYAGVVARYKGDAVNQAGMNNMYAALLVHVNGANYVQLYNNVNGAFILLSNTQVAFTTALLRMEVVGNSIKVYANGSLVGYGNDVFLASGSYGIMTSQGGKVDDLNIGTLPTGTGALRFQDDFGTPAVGAQLPLPWVNNAGNFVIDTDATTLSQVAMANAVGTSIASLSGVNAADVYSQALVTLAPGDGPLVGVIARANFTATNSSYYLGTLYRSGGTVYAIILKVSNGVTSTIGIATASPTTVTGTLRLEVVGTSMKLFLDGNLVTYGNDAAPLSAGSVGIYSTQNSTVDDFDGDAIPLLTPTLPFVEDFNLYVTGAQLDRNWIDRAGLHLADAGAVKSQAAFNVATLANTSQGDVAVQASITLDSAASFAYAGVLARYNSTAGGSYYAALIVKMGSTYYAQLYRNVNGVFTTLSSVDITSAYTPGGLARLEVAGDSLKLFYNGELKTYTNDAVLSSAAGGSVGMVSTQNNISDNFGAFANALNTVTIPPVFTDTFDGANGAQLSSDWVNHLGNFSTNANATVGMAPLNSASLNGLSIADSTTQADVALAAGDGTYVGLVARSTGSAFANSYIGIIYRVGGATYAGIFKFVNGASSVIGFQAIGSSSGTLRFDVVGDTLRLYLDGNLVASGFDSTFATGSLGLFATQSTSLNNFSADTVAPLSLPFTEPFNGTTLDPNWAVRLGSYTVAGNVATGATPGAQNFATVVGLSAADQDISATVSIIGNQTFALSARYTPGAGFGNQYFAYVFFNGTNYTAQIYRVVQGNFTLLSSQTAATFLGQVRLQVTGSNLILSLDATPVITITDTAITGPGSVGMTTFNGASVSAFQVI